MTSDAVLPAKVWAPGERVAYQQVHVSPPNVWTLTLDRYQRDNLLWLLNAVGYGAAPVAPFQLAHTGDWCGEIANQLAKTYERWSTHSDTTIGIDAEDRPNKSLDQLADDVDRWISTLDIPPPAVSSVVEQP